MEDYQITKEEALEFLSTKLKKIRDVKIKMGNKNETKIDIFGSDDKKDGNKSVEDNQNGLVNEEVDKQPNTRGDDSEKKDDENQTNSLVEKKVNKVNNSSDAEIQSIEDIKDEMNDDDIEIVSKEKNILTDILNDDNNTEGSINIAIGLDAIPTETILEIIGENNYNHEKMIEKKFSNESSIVSGIYSQKEEETESEDNADIVRENLKKNINDEYLNDNIEENIFEGNINDENEGMTGTDSNDFKHPVEENVDTENENVGSELKYEENVFEGINDDDDGSKDNDSKNYLEDSNVKNDNEMSDDKKYADNNENHTTKQNDIISNDFKNPGGSLGESSLKSLMQHDEFNSIDNLPEDNITNIIDTYVTSHELKTDDENFEENNNDVSIKVNSSNNVTNQDSMKESSPEVVSNDEDFEENNNDVGSNNATNQDSMGESSPEGVSNENENASNEVKYNDDTINYGNDQDSIKVSGHEVKELKENNIKGNDTLKNVTNQNSREVSGDVGIKGNITNNIVMEIIETGKTKQASDSADNTDEYSTENKIGTTYSIEKNVDEESNKKTSEIKYDNNTENQIHEKYVNEVSSEKTEKDGEDDKRHVKTQASKDEIDDENENNDPNDFSESGKDSPTITQNVDDTASNYEINSVEVETHKIDSHKVDQVDLITEEEFKDVNKTYSAGFDAEISNVDIDDKEDTFDVSQQPDFTHDSVSSTEFIKIIENANYSQQPNNEAQDASAWTER